MLINAKFVQVLSKLLKLVSNMASLSFLRAFEQPFLVYHHSNVAKSKLLRVPLAALRVGKPEWVF